MKKLKKKLHQLLLKGSSRTVTKIQTMKKLKKNTPTTLEEYGSRTLELI